MMKDKYRDILMERKGWGWLILLFLVATFAVQSLLQASESKNICQIVYINERLTVNVDNVALGSVLAAIREKTGIEFVLSREQSERLISIRFGSLPLVEGLKRMLSHFNHVFLFDPDNKLVKVAILGYAMPDSSPQPREVAETPRVQRVIPPSSAETRDIKPATKEGRVVASSPGIIHFNQPAGEDMIFTSSLETMVTKPTSVEDMVATPSTETMVIHPPVIDMIITPPSETMVIKPASVEMIVIPPTEAMASLVENMIIGGFTGPSKPKVPAN